MPRNISTITCRIEIFPVLFSIDRESWSLTLNEPCNREGIAQKSSLQKSSTENSREFAQGNWPWSVRYRFEIDSVLFASKSDSWSHFSRSSYSLTFRRSLNFWSKLCHNSPNGELKPSSVDLLTFNVRSLPLQSLYAARHLKLDASEKEGVRESLKVRERMRS